MKLTPEGHQKRIRAALEDGKSYREIAEILGCGKTSVRKFALEHLPELANRPLPPGSRLKRSASLADLPEQPTELELLRAEHARLKQSTRRHRTVDVQAELLLEEVRTLVTPADVSYEAPDFAEGSGKPHVQVLLLSDLHIGEVVDPEAVNGLNEYNWATFVERMTAVQQALFSFQNNRPYPIDELIIGLLGDNVSGNHHKELEASNEFPITEQCHRGGMFLAQWIEALVPHWPKIRIAGVGGNHARVDKMPASKYVFDSFDWLGYQYIDHYLSNYETVETHFPRSGMTVIEVAGRNMMLWHGDGVRSSMPGVPWGGVMRRTNELKKQYSESGTMIDYVALGHFHQANVVQGNIFMNGSLMGLNEYGLKNFGSGEKPTQLLLTFNREKRRLTDVSFITP